MDLVPEVMRITGGEGVKVGRCRLTPVEPGFRVTPS